MIGVKDGTRTKRCDLCTLWDPFSETRVLGWCTHISPKPLKPGFTLIMERLADDPVTSYNEVCEHLIQSERGKEMELENP